MPRGAHKQERWRRVIQEAAEQSGRGRLPLLHPPLPFEKACQEARGLSLLPYEEERETSLRQALWSRGGCYGEVNLFIGPEGGFSPSEVESARGWGVITVSLGPRILRAETAGLVAAAAILYEWGDLGDDWTSLTGHAG
jgi:16S rRNA (uracil1498-N3)-methyltransferase